MKIRFLLTTLLFLTTSCTQGKLTMDNLGNSNNVLATQKDANGNIYTIKVNPEPKQLYDFTVTLINAPENLVLTKAYAQYETDCVYMTNKFAGAYDQFRHSIPLEVKKIQDNVYHATVYGDAILNEDYQNTGKICHWELKFGIAHFGFNSNTSGDTYTASVGTFGNDFVSSGYWKDTVLYSVKDKNNTNQEYKVSIVTELRSK